MNPIIQQLHDLVLEPGEAAFCRLGQHSFLVKAGTKIIAFDPYLSPDPGRLIPPLIKPEEMEGLSLIFGSHDHDDHINRSILSAMSEASPDAMFVVPRAVKDSICEIPSSRMIGMNDPEEICIDGITIRAVAAAHEFLDQTEEGLYPYLGFLVSFGGISVYHAGDCCVYEGLLSKLSSDPPDAMLLPINGRDARRLQADCIGNMTYQEAADLAGWSGTKWVLPAHYDMFAMNLENVQLFLDYVHVKYPALQTTELMPGKIAVLKLNSDPKNKEIHT